jgi:hypothetical protein
MSRISSHRTLDALLQRLIAPQAATRRTAAKTLRKLKIKVTGSHVLAALKWEIKNPKSWETQAQMILAIGECGYAEALPFLQGMAKSPRQHAMVGVALGDAIVRLNKNHDHDAAPVLEILAGTDRDLIDGAFRAMAMLHMVPSPDAIATIVGFANQLPVDDALRLWVAAAAAGWDGIAVRTFLAHCTRSTREDLRKAAEASAAKNYLKWSVL